MSQKSEIRFEFVDLSVLNFFSLDSHFSRSKTANLFAVSFNKKWDFDTLCSKHVFQAIYKTA